MYEKHQVSGGVMAMTQGVIDGAKEMESGAIAAEQSAQTVYEAWTPDKP